MLVLKSLPLTKTDNDEILTKMNAVADELRLLKDRENELRQIHQFLQEIYEQEIDQPDPTDPNKIIKVKKEIKDRRTGKKMSDKTREEFFTALKSRYTAAM